MRRIDARAVPPADVAREVARVMAACGVAILPTDTVYGIFADPRKAAAIERIYALKNRPRDKALALHAGSVEAFLAIAGTSDAARALARAFLPGALTVIVDRPASIDAAVAAGKDSIGLRVPAHALAQTIFGATGPLAGTSANISGLPAFTGGNVLAEFPDADLFVDDGATPLGTESTVIDVSQGRTYVIREGAIPIAELEKVLGNLR